MNKNFLIYSLAVFTILLSVSSVRAEDVFREPTYRTDTDILFYNYPYWIEVNETGTLYVSNINTATNNYAEITLSGGNASNMTYLSGSTLFRTYLTSTIEENVNFTIVYKNSSGSVLGNMTDTLRFRVPFTVTMNFFKNKNTTTTETEAYDNEFQYAVMHLKSSGSGYSYELKSSNSLSWLNSIGNLFPYYTEIGSDTEEIRETQELYVFSRLNSGSAAFKVYENGTYTLHTMNSEIYGGLTSMYEFGRPISNGDLTFKSTLAGDIVIGTESSTSYTVFISAWEVYKWNLWKNIFKIIACLVVWGFLVVLVSFGITAWMPTDVRSQAFGTVLGVLAVATSPILIMAVRLVW